MSASEQAGRATLHCNNNKSTLTPEQSHITRTSNLHCKKNQPTLQKDGNKTTDPPYAAE